jgi:S1-C subfamily serine protease
MERHRPRVSRETRLLLGIVLVSIATLWVLARIRFPDQPATPNPVPPVLAQLAPSSPFEAIASTISDLLGDVGHVLMPLRFADVPSGGEGSFTTRPALRFREDLALTLVPPETMRRAKLQDDLDVVAHDPPSKVAVVRVPAAPVPPLRRWTPPPRFAPRFLLAATVSREGTSLTPVFVSSIASIESPWWPGPIWLLPPPLHLATGTFLFTTDGAMAGAVVAEGSRAALVPVDVLLSTAERLGAQGRRLPGHLGIEVQALTPPLRRALAADAGVVVTWVDPEGPAAAHLLVTDVIERLQDQPLTGVEDWTARLQRIAAGETVRIVVRRAGEGKELVIDAVERRPPPPADRPLGLETRLRPGEGAEVVSVQALSSAARAGLAPGDLITIAGDILSPRPGQIQRLYEDATGERPILLAVTRGGAHLVVALEKYW